MIRFFKSHRNLIINIVTGIIICLIVVYLINNRDVFTHLSEIKLTQLMLISAISICSVFVNSLINYYLITIYNVNMSLGDSFLLQYASTLLNSVTPQGGLIFRGMYMKNVYDFEYSKYFVVVIVFYVISFPINAMAGMISSLFIYLQTGKFNAPIILFFISIVIAIAVLILFIPNGINKKGKIFDYINKVSQGWHILKQNKRIMLLIVLSLLMVIVSFFQQLSIYSSLGESASFWGIVFLTAVGNLSLLINLTPSGIGIKEAVLVFSSDITTINPEVIVLGSILNRIIEFLIALVLGGIGYWILTKKLRKTSSE